jgi:hypothetical protein
MKTNWIYPVIAACLLVFVQVAPAQVGSSTVDSLVSSGNFVLEPNQLSGFNVNPVMNFVMLNGDNLIFQTSSPVDRTRANMPYTDKTVKGKITSKKISKDKKGNSLIKLGVMTEIGIGFRVDLRISPYGNASASVTQNNAAGRLDYSGRIVALDESSVFVGPESFDLTGFPWYYNFYMEAMYGRN